MTLIELAEDYQPQSGDLRSEHLDGYSAFRVEVYTGAAWERPRRRRSCRSRRFSSRCSAYASAVTPSIPGALDLLVWR